MIPIRKHIVTDESQQPVAIQLSMTDWLRIEPILREKGLISEKPIETIEIDHLLKATAGTWNQGDGLIYQQNIRDEWPNTHPPSPEEET